MPEKAAPPGPVRSVLDAALRRHDSKLRLRPEGESDLGFLIDLYTEFRWAELAPVGWPDVTKREFLANQCRLQRKHYEANYPGAELLLVERTTDGATEAPVPVGRVYIHCGHDEYRLMDILLRQELRGTGVGTTLLRALMEHAQQCQAGITLHVEPDNPAQRLYHRLGFTLLEQRGVYDFLGWSSAPRQETTDETIVESNGPAHPVS
jgi:ribosomal protein S18 acetylase RimI-like enzyme